jgi:hypothetical protein
MNDRRSLPRHQTNPNIISFECVTQCYPAGASIRHLLTYNFNSTVGPQHHGKVRTFCTCNHHDHGFEIRRVVLSLCNFNLIVDNHPYHTGTLQSKPLQIKQLVHYFPPESIFLVSVQFSSVQLRCRRFPSGSVSASIFV